MNAKRHMAEVAMLPCIVCKLTGKGNTPAHVHHLLSGGKRIDDFHVIPLCPGHHNAGLNTEEIVSRHPWRKEFESRYGTEQELLTLTLEELDKVRGGA